MKNIKNFILSLQFIFKPRYWAMNKPYSKAHDKLLTELMDKYKFTNYNAYTAKINNYSVWVANMPYAVGIEPYDQSSRLTIQRLHKRVIEDTIDLTHLNKA
jgi:hypothetical protein